MRGKRVAMSAGEISSDSYSMIILLYSHGECMIDVSCFGHVESASLDNKSPGGQDLAVA